MQVIVDIAHSNVDKIFDYRLPPGLTAGVGCRVKIPFGRTETEGIVLSHKTETEIAEDRLKDVIRCLDDRPVVNREQILLAQYVCARYRTTMAFALRLMFPAKIRGGRIHKKKIRMARVTDAALAAQARAGCFTKEGVVRAKNRLHTLDRLLEGPCPTALLDAASVRALAQKDILEVYFETSYRRPYEELCAPEKDITPTDEQVHAIRAISAAIDAGKNRTFLLHGVTSSGKTEVYIACVKRALSLGKTAIVLVPEISITPQALGEFARHFGEEIAVFHSGLSDGERFDEWRRVRDKKARIVLGARSAVFSPLENIGVIILDEEQAETYKAENHPAYHAAEIANMRCKMTGAALVLASATPLIEDYVKAELGIYHLLEMPHRVGNIPLPDIRVVDMKKEYMRGNRGPISGLLHEEIKKMLANGEQSLIFLNRRGYASSLVCPSCGHVRMCTHCDVPLKYHKNENRLLCHYCGRSFPLEETCPECGGKLLKFAGTGTEKIEEQIRSLFPGARVLRMDFDTTRRKNAHAEIYEAFRDHKADILIGTQMISRGLDFSNVGLAAIISADSLLYAGDYRQEERTFAMIEQVGGRAGRVRKGTVVVQTFNPENYAVRFAAAHDYKGFYRQEVAFRKASCKPPFGRFFRMVFTHADEARAQKACAQARIMLEPLLQPYASDILLFAAKPAPVARLEGKARYHILLKVRTSRTTAQIRDHVWDVWDAVRKKGVLVSVDTDPYNMN